MTNPKILLTGASGGLGKAISSLSSRIVPISARAGLAPTAFAQIYNELLLSPDAFVHAGANLAHNGDMAELLTDNVRLTDQLLDIVLKIGNVNLPVFVISSHSVLLNSGAYKTEEEMAPYTLSKYKMEQMVQEKYPELTNTHIVRFSTLFYKDHRRDGLSKMIHNAKTKGKIEVWDCYRDFLPIDVAAQYVVDAVSVKSLPRYLNIGSGTSISMRDIAEHLRAKYGTKLEFKGRNEADVPFQYSPPSYYGLQFIPVDILKEVDDYYARINLCDGC